MHNTIETCTAAYPTMVMQLSERKKSHFVGYKQHHTLLPMKDNKHFLPILPCERNMQDKPT
jgi:hypothetical protein